MFFRFRTTLPEQFLFYYEIRRVQSDETSPHRFLYSNVYCTLITVLKRKTGHRNPHECTAEDNLISCGVIATVVYTLSYYECTTYNVQQAVRILFNIRTLRRATV